MLLKDYYFPIFDLYIYSIKLSLIYKYFHNFHRILSINLIVVKLAFFPSIMLK